MSEGPLQHDDRDVEGLASQLSATGALTERQARAFALRAVYGYSRAEAATEMSTSASNVDNLFRTARAKVRSSKEIVAILSEFADE